MIIASTARRTFFVTTLLLAGQLSVAAQQLPSTLPDLRTSMWHGETVSVIDRAGATVKGRVVKITDDAITLSVHGQTHTVNGSDVGWITRRRAHAGRGALLGLSVGAAVGLFTYLHGRDYCETCGADTGFAFVLGAMFGGIGGGIGAGVGAAIHSEEMLYAASTASPTPHRRTATVNSPATMSVRVRF